MYSITETFLFLFYMVERKIMQNYLRDIYWTSSLPNQRCCKDSYINTHLGPLSGKNENRQPKVNSLMEKKEMT